MIPQTRKEVFYNAILNGGDTPTPVTREEMYLAEIAKNGSGGGGGGGGLLVTDTDGTLDKKAGEIYAAVEAGGSAMLKTTYPNDDVEINSIFASIKGANGNYSFYVYTYNDAKFYEAATEEDYPVLGNY